MGIAFGNPEPITKDLIWAVDIGNNGSYPGSGTIVYDIAGNRNASLTGTINYTTDFGGRLAFAGGQTSSYITFPESALQSLTNSYEWTIETVFSIDNQSGTNYFHSMASSANNNVHIIQKNTTFFAWNETRTAGSNVSFSPDELMIFTIRHSGTSQEYYKNGSYIGTWTQANDIKTTQGWILNQEQDSVKGSFDANQATGMKFYSCSLYDRALTAAEISTNFDIKRARYNL